MSARPGKFEWVPGRPAELRAARRGNARQRAGAALLPFEGELLTRAQIAERVQRSDSHVSTRVRALRARAIRNFTREHFA